MVITLLNVVRLFCGPWECNHGMLGAQFIFESSHAHVPMAHRTKYNVELCDGMGLEVFLIVCCTL